MLNHTAMEASSKPRGGCRRSRRLIDTIQKLNCTLPNCKGTVDRRQNIEEDENPYFFPVIFPEMFEPDVMLQETFNSRTVSTSLDEPTNPTQEYCHDSFQTRTSTAIVVGNNSGAKNEVAVATTTSVATSICSQTRLEGEPQPPLTFDGERYTYSPEPPLDDEAAMEPPLHFDDNLDCCDVDLPDRPIGRIRTDQSSGVPLMIQFATGESKGGLEIVHGFCREQSFPSTHRAASEDTLSTRTPVGHFQEEDNDSSRDQPSLTSKRSRCSRQSRIQHQRRIASYTAQDCETYTPSECSTYTPSECSPSISRAISSSTNSNNYHFVVDEPPMHRCFRMKCSPGESKPTSHVAFDAPQRKTLSDKFGEVQKPASVRGASLSNTTIRSGTTEVTVATTQSTISIGSRASSSGMRVQHLIPPSDWQTLDRCHDDSESTITPMSIPPVLREDVAFKWNDCRQALRKSSRQLHFLDEVCGHTEESIGMVGTSFDAYHRGVTGDHYYQYDGLVQTSNGFGISASEYANPSHG